jgi:hypothetical protein
LSVMLAVALLACAISGSCRGSRRVHGQLDGGQCRDRFQDRCAEATNGNGPRSEEATTSILAVSPGVVGLLDLNQRPHPYQLHDGNRCADRPFPRSRPTVSAKGMRSIGVLACVLPRGGSVPVALCSSPWALLQGHAALHRCSSACRPAAVHWHPVTRLPTLMLNARRIAAGLRTGVSAAGSSRRRSPARVGTTRQSRGGTASVWLERCGKQIVQIIKSLMGAGSPTRWVFVNQLAAAAEAAGSPRHLHPLK